MSFHPRIHTPAPPQALRNDNNDIPLIKPPFSLNSLPGKILRNHKIKCYSCSLYTGRHTLIIIIILDKAFSPAPPLAFMPATLPSIHIISCSPLTPTRRERKKKFKSRQKSFLSFHLLFRFCRSRLAFFLLSPYKAKSLCHVFFLPREFYRFMKKRLGVKSFGRDFQRWKKVGVRKKKFLLDNIHRLAQLHLARKAFNERNCFEKKRLYA